MKPVWENADFVLSRGRLLGYDESVWSVACTVNCTPGAWLRLEREFELRDVFDSSWALRPVAIEERSGRKQLILADPGGELLLSCLAAPHSFATRLALAMSAAACVRQLHARELIHRDIHPASLVVDVARARVWLRGTGSCSRWPRGREHEGGPAVRSGTLQYMSPEQTGRINRSVDSRSDLYSLGITLYELFAGKHPFSASEPLEWMHCHVARQPALLHQAARGVPLGVSAVVHKLIAKTPEDRYQTAAGLEADLRHCLLELERTGDVASFPLGRHDVSSELRIPERLYGRAHHLEVLRSALAAVTATGQTRVVSITGGSGVGKSSLVKELQTEIIAAGGYLAAGKVDQLKRDIPYASVAEACRALVRTTLGHRDAEIDAYRSAMREAMGANGQLMVNLIPELEHLIGKQRPPAELSPDEAKTRFHHLFQRFLGVFASPGRPLTLFLDDVQWLDTAALELLQALIAGHSEQLLILCAYRENELVAPHPFLETVALLRDGSKSFEELRLDVLTDADLSQLLTDSLRVSEQRARPLAAVVRAKTAGNPFFVIQFITSLVQEGLLAFRVEQGWTWDLARIRDKESTDNVMELMVARFHLLPPDTRRVLTHLACLGPRASTARLASICGLSASEVDGALWELARSQLLYTTEVGYGFAHDRVQEASYALIPEPERAAMHLKIARILAASPHTVQSNEQLFEIVFQYDRGAALIASTPEREQLARLYLEAGHRSRQSMAHGSARAYFVSGRALLGESAWETAYELCVALELGAAEATFLSGDPGEAVQLLSSLAQRTRTHRDGAAVTRLLIIVYSALDQHMCAVDVCLRFLRGTGIDWTPHPSREQVRTEYQEILRALDGRPIESLIDLPLMIDEDRRATLDALSAMLPVAIFIDENLNGLAICRMVNMSLAYGNSSGSCFAYVMLGRILNHYFGDPEAGIRFGRVAFELSEKPAMSTYRARVASVFSVTIHPWTYPVASSVPLVRKALDIARQTGDLTFAAYNGPCLITLLLACGAPLTHVEQEARARLKLASDAKFGQMADMVRTQIQLIRSLTGLTESLTSFAEDDFDDRTFQEHLVGNPGLTMAACWYWIRKLQGRYLGGDFHGALEAADRAGPLLWTSGGFIDEVEYEYYAALSLAALYDQSPEDQRAEIATRIERHRTKLAARATHCASNFEDKATLVAAEHAHILGRELEAMRLYERAITAAKDNGFVHGEAIAHEVAARFFKRAGLTTSAQAHLTAARSCYRRWGATAKQRQLDALLSTLDATAEPIAQARPSPEDVDMATVVKTSLAVSHQVGHERVVRSLMEVAVEHAGAQRGLLLLESSGEMRMEAEATTRDTVEVELSPSHAHRALPESIIRYVVRTRETVLLDDGMAPHQFANDPYFAGHTPRSLLCLPIQKQTELMGVLYLENRLAPYVFTYTRVEVLKLLAAQAAISLENASLEEKEALLKEVHHRVKNNLQLISSMLNLQAARVTDPQVVELFVECRNRVRSIALVHENLYRAGNFSHILMEEHITSLCAGLSRAYGADSRGITIDVAVDDLYLTMAGAITCGLIINELVANALKHGFPEERVGTVRVELTEKEPGTYELSVADDGIGLGDEFDFARAETLGLQLVHDFVQQLNGKMRASSQAGRTRFAVTFPAAEPSEPERPMRSTYGG